MTYASKARDTEWKYARPKRAAAEGHLAVGDGHRIYWYEYGNAHGEPVMYVHGGPGGGTSPANARFFDPKRYRIIVFDQRGCGKSTPHVADDAQAALRHNTTANLIADMEALRKHLKIRRKMHVFGGSWGSTLSLAYAIQHPQHVRTLILRGIFLCRPQDIAYFYQGNAATYHKAPQDMQVAGTYLFYPEAWKPYVEQIPVRQRGDMIKAYARIFATKPKNAKARTRQNNAAKAWTLWEGSTSALTVNPAEMGSFTDLQFAKALALIENHYFMNGAFFTGHGAKARNNNYLIEQVKRIAHLPVHIVQGQYDQVCPRQQADALVEALKKHKAKKVNYVLTPAGHSASERETMLALTHIMDMLGS